MAIAPKLRPLKTDAEIKAIPTDQPVLIELPAAVSNSEPPPTSGTGAATGERHAPAAEGAQALQTQLQALKDARAADAARIAQAERDRDAALARVREAEQDAVGAEQRAVTTGLAGAQADLAAAQQSFQVAYEAGDGKGMADAQAKIGRASAKVLNYEQQGAEAAARVEEAKRAPAPAAQQQNTDPMVAMESNPQLYPQEKDWFRRHPETWTDRRMNVRLEDGYFRAMDKGLTRGTPEYFQFLDQHMGYTAARTQNGAGNGGAHDDEGSSAMAAAPVSRENGSMTNGQAQPGQVILTPEQREIAASMGISEVAYAQQVVRMREDKKARPEAYYMPPGRN